MNQNITITIIDLGNYVVKRTTWNCLEFLAFEHGNVDFLFHLACKQAHLVCVVVVFLFLFS